VVFETSGRVTSGLKEIKHQESTKKTKAQQTKTNTISSRQLKKGGAG